MASRGVALTQFSKARSAESIPTKCRILHLNDADIDHEVLTKLFKPDRSFSIERARSGVEAMQQLGQKAELPNLVIVSWSFARIGCDEFIDQMKSDQRLAVIPIIVMASAISSEEIMRAYDAGAACVVQTGSDAESLVRSLQAIKNFWRVVMLPFCDSPTGKIGGTSKASKVTAKQRSALAKKAVQARWAKTKAHHEPIR